MPEDRDQTSELDTLAKKRALLFFQMRVWEWCYLKILCPLTQS